MPTTIQKVRVFYSYSHSDERLRNKLENHLSMLKHEGLIEEWHDRKISAGMEWGNSIDEHLETADVILLLVSASFLASNYCYNIEMQHALARHDAGLARVIPIILKTVDWQGAPFGKLQALPSDAKPVTGKGWRNHDEAWADVAKGIRRVINELRGAQAANYRLADDADRCALPIELREVASEQKPAQCEPLNGNNREASSKLSASATPDDSTPVSIAPRKSSLKDTLVGISLQILDPLSSSQKVPVLAVQLRNTGNAPLFISHMRLQITVDSSYQEEEELANLSDDLLLQESNPPMHSAFNPQERRIFKFRLSTLVAMLQGKGTSITVNELKIRDESGETVSVQLPLLIRTALEVQKQPSVSKAMEWHKVTSSNLDKVRYDTTNYTLEICFKSGSVYQYYDVPERVFYQLLASPSKGSFLHTTIKRYPYKQVS